MTTYVPTKNNMIRLHCGTKVIYMGRKCPPGTDPDTSVQCTPGVGIHERCCRCDCPCEVYCTSSDPEHVFSDHFEGSGPLGPPWTVNGNWAKNGNSEAELFHDSAGDVTLNVGTGGNELVMWLDGRVDPTSTPGDVVKLGLIADGYLGGVQFSMEFFCFHDVTAGQQYTTCSVSVGGLAHSRTIDWPYYPNVDLSISMRVVVNDERTDLEICARVNNQFILGGRLENIAAGSYFDGMDIGFTGIATGANVAVDLYTHCYPVEAPRPCLNCYYDGPPAEDHTPSRILWLTPSDDSSIDDGECDLCDVVFNNIPHEIIQQESPGNPCRWEGIIGDCLVPSGPLFQCDNDWRGAAWAQVVFEVGVGVYWEAELSLTPIQLDPGCSLYQPKVYYRSDPWPYDPLGLVQCDTFPHELHYVDPQPIGYPPWPEGEDTVCAKGDFPSFLTLTDAPPVGFIAGPSSSPRKAGPQPVGSWLWQQLISKGILKTRGCGCRGDILGLNKFSPDWWDNMENLRWLGEVIEKQARRQGLHPSVDVIATLLIQARTLANLHQ